MKKTYQIHLRIENSIIDQLKKQAVDNNYTLAELCRRKIKGDSLIDKLETLIKRLEKISTMKEI